MSENVRTQRSTSRLADVSVGRADASKVRRLLGTTSMVARRSQLGHELRVPARAQAAAHGPVQRVPGPGEERLGVQPQTREDLRAINLVRAGRQILEMIAATDEPVDA